jgi:hypothetical protein
VRQQLCSSGLDGAQQIIVQQADHFGVCGMARSSKIIIFRRLKTIAWPFKSDIYRRQLY